MQNLKLETVIKLNIYRKLLDTIDTPINLVYLKLLREKIEVMKLKITPTKNNLFPIKKTIFLKEIENLEHDESLKQLIELYSKNEDYKSSLEDIDSENEKN